MRQKILGLEAKDEKQEKTTKHIDCDRKSLGLRPKKTHKKINKAR